MALLHLLAAADIRHDVVAKAGATHYEDDGGCAGIAIVLVQAAQLQEGRAR
jgi:hypothetical protein